MNRFVTRSVLSHAVVALVALIVAFLSGRHLAHHLIDESIRQALESTQLTVPQAKVIETEVLEGSYGAINAALVAGLVVGLVIAAAGGALSAYREGLPLARLTASIRAMAGGEYAVRLPEAESAFLREVTRELNALGGTLADTEERRRRLLGEVAHEMRTPLTIIDGYVEAMIDGVIPAAPGELARISDEVRRLRRLAGDLSDLARAEDARLELRLSPLDLSDVVRATTESLRPQLEDAGLTVQVQTATVPLPVRVDADRLGQVVRNLLGNALRATGPGGALLVRTGRTGDWTWLRVEDTGEGIDPADLERIFERFYRVPTRRGGSTDGGSGIGLTIARGIIRAHGGELVARSGGRGHGAELIAWLPAAPGSTPVGSTREIQPSRP